MDKNAKTFGKLATKLRGAHPSGGEDALDHVNYGITPGMLIIIASVLGTRQYVFQAIQCWSIKEVEGKRRMRYAENYCWVENTFLFDSDEPMPHSEGSLWRKDRTVHYYQWVPFILMAQAVLFYIPHLIWLLLSTNVGIDMRQLAVQARKIDSECSDAEDRHKKIAFLSDSLLKFIRYRSRYRQKSWCKRLLSFVFGKPAFAMYFVFIYIFVKSCYVANCIGQLYLMRSFLGLNITTFGLQILSDISNNRTWQSSNIFPRVTYCHFEVRGVGKPRPYILQCVLPVNMLNEKFYIAIWFWVVILLTLNIISTSRCLMQLLVSPMRRATIEQYFNTANLVSQKDGRKQRRQSLERQFANDCLNTDGLFVLTVISRNAGHLNTSEVVVKAYEVWRNHAQPICVVE